MPRYYVVFYLLHSDSPVMEEEQPMEIPQRGQVLLTINTLFFKGGLRESS